MKPRAFERRIPHILEAELGGVILHNETVLYRGQPSARATSRRLRVLFIFGAVWSAAAIAQTPFAADWLAASPIASPDGSLNWMSLFLMLMSGLFVLAGLGMAGYPVYVAARSKDTLHAVTTRHIITVVAGKGLLERCSLDRITGFRIDREPDGSANLILELGHEEDSDGDPRPVTTVWSGIPQIDSARHALVTVLPRRVAGGAFSGLPPQESVAAAAGNKDLN